MQKIYDPISKGTLTINTPEERKQIREDILRNAFDAFTFEGNIREFHTALWWYNNRASVGDARMFGQRVGYILGSPSYRLKKWLGLRSQLEKDLEIY